MGLYPQLGQQCPNQFYQQSPNQEHHLRSKGSSGHHCLGELRTLRADTGAEEGIHVHP